MIDDARYAAAVAQAAWTITIICGFIGALLIGATIVEYILPAMRRRLWLRRLRSLERGRRAQGGSK